MSYQGSEQAVFRFSIEPEINKKYIGMGKTGIGYILIGILLIVVGIIGNEWVLAHKVNHFSFDFARLSRIAIRCCQLLFLAIGLYLIFRSREKLGNDLKNFGLLISSMLLSLILLEIALRLITPNTVFHPIFELIPYQKDIILVELPGVADTVYASTNKWGLRGDPIPGNWENLTSILMIGGSTTYCMYLSDNKTWPYLLQDFLRQDDPSVIVQNSGHDGHTTYAHLIMMEEVVPVIKPKVVIMLVGVNDMRKALRQGRHRIVNRLEESRSIFRLYSYSRTVQLALKWYQVIINKVPLVDKIEYTFTINHQPIPVDDNKSEQDILGRAESLTDEFQVHLIEIIKCAQASGIKLLFITQPGIYDDTEYWQGIRAQWSYAEKNQVFNSAATESKILNIFNQKLMNICESEGIACFDLASAVPHSSEYFYDDYHFNESGAEFVAEQIYSYIRESNFIKTANH
ncbi:hypothetical protein CEE37_05025 [candidate division LCP-89 bacterium B3_LCP]|uniref:SGNH hydrolase-type esterase domain-containing protein n=1 Tax=candidate division LCP-89 bacterium B3_LCP TaxID=2012998 RepID=A0A532V1D7_UNCL8|nr:MAG: hypothetical protein CEE37_05025 [candidate division LCP-89 bacterium B3_LCP]